MIDPDLAGLVPGKTPSVATEVAKLLREKLKTPLSPTQEDSYSKRTVTDWGIGMNASMWITFYQPGRAIATMFAKKLRTVWDSEIEFVLASHA